MLKINYNSAFFLILITIINLLLVNCQEKNASAPTVELQNQTHERPTIKTSEEKKIQDEVLTLMQEYYQEWEKKMIDYNSDYDYNIPLRPRIQEIYFENVTTVPSTFKGAFLISDETTDKIEFIVKDPNDKIIYQVTKHHDIFEIPIKLVGKYTIIFNNRISKSNIMIIFTMNTGQNNLINAKDLSKTEQKLEALNNVIKKFNLEFKFGHDIHTKRYISKYIYILMIFFYSFIEINKTNNYFYIFAFVETIVLIIVSIWQSYYMKHLFEVKGSL